MAGLDPDETHEMTFEVTEGGDGTVTVRVTGELDMTNVDTIASAVAPVLERAPARLVVDVGSLRFADSSAIALWVRWASEVSELELRHVPSLLRKVVESMGLTETLKVTS